MKRYQTLPPYPERTGRRPAIRRSPRGVDGGRVRIRALVIVAVVGAVLALIGLLAVTSSQPVRPHPGPVRLSPSPVGALTDDQTAYLGHLAARRVMWYVTDTDALSLGALVCRTMTDSPEITVAAMDRMLDTYTGDPRVSALIVDAAIGHLDACSEVEL